VLELVGEHAQQVVGVGGVMLAVDVDHLGQVRVGARDLVLAAEVAVKGRAVVRAQLGDEHHHVGVGVHVGGEAHHGGDRLEDARGGVARGGRLPGRDEVGDHAGVDGAVGPGVVGDVHVDVVALAVAGGRDLHVARRHDREIVVPELAGRSRAGLRVVDVVGVVDVVQDAVGRGGAVRVGAVGVAVAVVVEGVVTDLGGDVVDVVILLLLLVTGGQGEGQRQGQDQRQAVEFLHEGSTPFIVRQPFLAPSRRQATTFLCLLNS